MWQQIFLGFLGLCSGIIIAGGAVGLMIGLSIVPRYAGITRTADSVLLYEDMTLHVFMDDNKGLFAVAFNMSEQNNPDIVPLSAITSCRLEIDEQREEEEYTDQDGETRSYVPPRYTYSYDYKIKLSVNTPWFDDMDFQLNTFSVEDRERAKMMKYEQLGNQIVSALTGVPAPVYGGMMNQGYPQQGSGDTWVCGCGAVNTGRFCEYCGTPKP